MSEKENHFHQIRDKAEAKLAKMTPSEEVAARKTDELIHELQVHQIELEMQNEELRRTQLCLEEIKDRYMELYDFAPVGYFIFTCNGLIKEVNLTGSVFLGLTRQKLLSRGFGHFVVPGDLKLWDDYIACTLKNWEKQTCELMLKRDDGSMLFVRMDSIRMEAGEGTTEIRTAMTDITHHRLIGEEVRSVQEYTENVLDTVREPMIVVDEKLTVVSASHSFYHTFGVSPGESIGLCLYDIANGLWNIPKLRDLLENILPKHTKIENVEVMQKIPSLGCRKMILNARRIPGKEGKTQFLLLAMEDVTEHMPVRWIGGT